MFEFIFLFTLLVGTPTVISYFASPAIALFFDKKFFLRESKYQHGLIGHEYCIIIEHLTSSMARTKVYSSYSATVDIIDVNRITIINKLDDEEV